MPRIVWHGHSCFEIIDSRERSIVIDPHDGGSIGLKKPNARADAVLVTHDHFDHNAYSLVLKKGGELHFMKEGEFSVLGHKAKGIKVYHDSVKGRRRGEVISYLLEVDGLRILHLGDIGEIPSEEKIREMDNPHVLMVPVGGTFTVNGRGAKEIIELLKPKAAVPMHYWIQGINLPLAPLEHFYSVINYEVIELESNTWNADPRDLEEWEEVRVVVFRYTP